MGGDGLAIRVALFGGSNFTIRRMSATKLACLYVRLTYGVDEGLDDPVSGTLLTKRSPSPSPGRAM